MKKAIYPGSFDPMTLGHLDVIERASKLFDHLIIGVLNNSAKSPLFSIEERVNMIKEAVKDIPNVRVCLDYGHAALTLTSMEDWVKALAPYIAHMHVNDHDLKADLHLPPGQGQIDFEHFKELLGRFDVNVSTLLEVNGIDNQEKALEFMSAL